MIEAAEQSGAIRRGATLVEATAGNTGLGLALVAARKGYRLILVIPDKMSQEKIFHLRAMGAEVRMTRSDVAKGHPEYYQDMAERIAAETGAYYVNQFGNPANPHAHETTTGPEIWRADRRAARRGGVRRRFRRHDHRPQPLLRPRRAAGRDGAGRSRRLRAGRLRTDRAASAKPARGSSRASARTSCRPSPISRACGWPTRSPTRRAC